MVELKFRLDGHQGPVTNLHYSCDSKYLISASQDSTLRIWALETHKEISRFSGHIGSVNSFALSHDDSTVLSGGSDSSLFWWDSERSEAVNKIKCHEGPVNSVCFNDDCSFGISGSFDSKVKIWDVRSPFTPVQTLSESKDSITAVATSKHCIFSSSVDGVLRVYDIRQSSLTVDSFSNGIAFIEISHDRQSLLMSTLNSKVVLYVMHTGESVQTYDGHICQSFVIKCHFAANDGAVVCGSENGDVFIWELVDGAVQQQFRFLEGPVLDVAVQKPFVSIAVGSVSGSIGVFGKSEHVKR
jgi:mitogen-activated protein kinase organizer 1